VCECGQGIAQLRAVLASPHIQLSRQDEARIRCTLSYGLASIGDVRAGSEVLLAGSVRIPALRIRYALSLLPVVVSHKDEYPSWRDAMRQAVGQTRHAIQTQSLMLSGEVGPLDLGGDLAYWLTYQVGGGWVMRSSRLPLACTALLARSTASTADIALVQGLNDKQLRANITALYKVAWPQLSFVSPRLKQPGMYSSPVQRGNLGGVPSLRRRIRIGFLSDFLYHHSVGKMITRLVTGLPRSLFHVTVLRFLGHSDWVQRTIDGAADEVVVLPESQGLDTMAE